MSTTTRGRGGEKRQNIVCHFLRLKGCGNHLSTSGTCYGKQFDTSFPSLVFILLCFDMRDLSLLFLLLLLLLLLFVYCRLTLSSDTILVSYFIILLSATRVIIVGFFIIILREGSYGAGHQNK